MRKILVVEDEEILREMYEVILSTQPYLVDVAENGQVALDKCRENIYDLVLLDLMMPIMDGVGFLKNFSALDSVKTKIIILSNLSSGKELEAAMALGAHRNALKADMSPKQVVALIRYELEAV